VARVRGGGPESSRMVFSGKKRPVDPRHRRLGQRSNRTEARMRNRSRMPEKRRTPDSHGTPVTGWCACRIQATKRNNCMRTSSSTALNLACPAVTASLW